MKFSNHSRESQYVKPRKNAYLAYTVLPFDMLCNLPCIKMLTQRTSLRSNSSFVIKDGFILLHTEVRSIKNSFCGRYIDCFECLHLAEAA